MTLVYLAAFCHAYCINLNYDFGAYKKQNCQCVDLHDAEAALKPLKRKIRKSETISDQDYNYSDQYFKKYLDY